MGQMPSSVESSVDLSIRSVWPPPLASVQHHRTAFSVGGSRKAIKRVQDFDSVIVVVVGLSSHQKLGCWKLSLYGLYVYWYVKKISLYLFIFSREREEKKTLQRRFVTVCVNEVGFQVSVVTLL